MPPFPAHVTLGRTGFEVGPLGVAGGYGVDERSLLRAFDRGVNYWYHGSLRRDGMTKAIRTLVSSGQRDRLVLVLQSYSRFGWLLERILTRGLTQLGVDRADVLLLGWHNGPLSERLWERVERLRERGLFRHVAISSHSRPAFVAFAGDLRCGILQIRYNAAHTGAERDVFPHLPTSGRPGVVAYTATSWGQLLSPRRMPQGEAPLRGRDCYRFVLSNADFNVCMTGPKDASEMDEALAALDAGPLAPDEEARFRHIGQHIHG
jgi:aryl-alcohol dehydrogenase-like predicted oxidoreductase